MFSETWITSATCLSSDKGGSTGERADMQSWTTLCKAAWQACVQQFLLSASAQGALAASADKSQLCRGGISHLQTPCPAQKPRHPLLKNKQHLPTRDGRANSRYSFGSPSPRQLLKGKKARQTKNPCRTDAAQRTPPVTLLTLTPTPELMMDCVQNQRVQWMSKPDSSSSSVWANYLLLQFKERKLAWRLIDFNGICMSATHFPLRASVQQAAALTCR